MVGLGKARMGKSDMSLFEMDQAFRSGRKPEFSIELTFSGLDAAIASDKGPSCVGGHSVVGRLKMDIAQWDGHDAFEGCSAVMLRGNSGSPVSYY